MGRMHPIYCEHDNMIDGGSFYEIDEVPGCPDCEVKYVQRCDDLKFIRQALVEAASCDYCFKRDATAALKLFDQHCMNGLL